jgi:polyhydroxybutyrate depolymerase
MVPVAASTAALLTSLLLGLAAPAGAALGPGDHAGTLVHDGVERVYDLRIPAGYDGSAPLPLVLDLHGYLSSKSGQRFFSGLGELADAEGFAIAWPQGRYGADGDPEGINSPSGPSWNAGFCCGQAAQDQPDDVGFLRTLVEAIARQVTVDRRRVYVTGLSNGGAMSQRLACQAADLFAAAAPVSFPIALVPPSSCQPSRPIPVLTFQGLTDSLVPYDGGGPFPSAAESFALWRSADGCGDGDPEQQQVIGASRCDVDTSCAGGVEVGLCSVLSTSGAVAPGHILYINDDIDLAQAIWAFLGRFELPGEPRPLPELAAGRKLELKDGPDASRRKLSLKLGPPALPGGGVVDPTTDGAWLQLYNTNGTGESLCVLLPADGWKGKGAGFAYRDPKGAFGPCQKAQLVPGKKLAVACRGKSAPLEWTLDEPSQGSLGALFGVGERAACARFGGVKRDTGMAQGKARFLAGKTEPPEVCQAPPAPCPAPLAPGP